VFSQGWVIKSLVAGETLNIFLLTGISKTNIFLIKENNNVVVTSKKNSYVASKILTYNIQKNSTETNVLKNNKMDCQLRGYWVSALFLDLARTVLLLQATARCI
jgi:hypothetical protein